MRKLYTMAAALLMASASFAQVNVTYKVDITDYLAAGNTLGANGIRIGGNFTTNGANPYGTIIKIDLSDASLFNSTIEPFTDAACSIRLNDSYYFTGVPGFDGCSFIYLRNTDSPSTIYLKISNKKSLILQIIL